MNKGNEHTIHEREIYLVDKHMLECLVLLLIRERQSKAVPIKF